MTMLNQRSRLPIGHQLVQVVGDQRPEILGRYFFGDAHPVHAFAFEQIAFGVTQRAQVEHPAAFKALGQEGRAVEHAAGSVVVIVGFKLSAKDLRRSPLAESANSGRWTPCTRLRNLLCMQVAFPPLRAE